MTMPSQCPRCQAPLPESIEQIGINSACRICGQILRTEGSPLPIERLESPAPIPEPVEEPIADEPLRLPPLDVLLEQSWRIFRRRMGLCVGAFSVWFGLNMLLILPVLAAEHLLRTQQMAVQTQVQLAFGIAIFRLSQVVIFSWLKVGYCQLLLKVVRGQSARIRDLFGGGAFFWRALWCSLIMEAFFLVMAQCILYGSSIFILPAVVVALMFWPFMYVLVDRDQPGIVALWQSLLVTHGHKAALFSLFAICFILETLGMLALGLGAFIAFPVTFLVTAMAYDSLSGIRVRTRSKTQANDDR